VPTELAGSITLLITGKLVNGIEHGGHREEDEDVGVELAGIFIAVVEVLVLCTCYSNNWLICIGWMEIFVGVFRAFDANVHYAVPSQRFLVLAGYALIGYLWISAGPHEIREQQMEGDLEQEGPTAGRAQSYEMVCTLGDNDSNKDDGTPHESVLL
jgi:hypothetical protein